VLVTQFQKTEAYSILILTRLMKSNNKLPNEEKDKTIIHIMPNSFIEHEKINNQHADGSFDS
jgi:hypothetical protein